MRRLNAGRATILATGITLIVLTIVVVGRGGGLPKEETTPYNSLRRHHNSADYLNGKPAEILNQNLLQQLLEYEEVIKVEPVEEKI